MLTHTLSSSGLQALNSLIGECVDQIVWDINAIYVVEPNRTTKIQADSAISQFSGRGSPEVFPIAVHVLGRMDFKSESEPRKVYRVMAENLHITNIEVIRMGVLFDPERVVHPSEIAGSEKSANIIDCGIMIHTPGGVLLAFQRHPRWGFGTKAPVTLSTDYTARASLPSQYELIQVASMAT